MATRIGSSMPNVAVHESESSFDSTSHANMIMEAGDLFVRCNNAVFRGSTIRARMIEMLVSGDLTIETLTDTFRSDSHSSQIAGSLASIAGLVQGVKTDRAVIDPKLGVVPTIRIADEDTLRKKVNQLSQLVGVEKFYLKVGKLLYNKGGMISDGVVAGSRIDEKVTELDEKHRRVINPCVGELVAMMGQVDEFKEVQQRYMTQRVSEGASAETAKKEAQGITREVVEKIANLKQRLMSSQRRLAQKAKEISERNAEIKISDEMDQGRLLAEIVRCMHVKELNDEIARALVEQESIKQEYDKFALSLKPGVKSFFDRVIQSTLELCKTIADGCYKFNDHLERAGEIGWMHVVCDDDTLLDAYERQAFKEQVINREMRERQHGLLEFANAALSVAEVVGPIKAASSVMRNATKILKLSSALGQARIAYGHNINQGLQLRAELAAIEQGFIDRKGQLTLKTISDAFDRVKSNSSYIVTVWEKLKNPALKIELNKINPNQKWVKTTTDSFELIQHSGQKAQIHFYINTETGQVYTGMDFKIKVEPQALGLFKYQK